MKIKGYGFIIFPILLDTDRNTSQWDVESWQWKTFSWIVKLIWKLGLYPANGCPTISIYQKVDPDTQREVLHLIERR